MTENITLTKVSLAQRMNGLTHPIIIPVEDKFSLVGRKTKKGRVFIVVSNPIYKDTNAVCEWAKYNLGGDEWHVPTLHIAGMDWAINPKYSASGWLWLLVKI